MSYSIKKDANPFNGLVLQNDHEVFIERATPVLHLLQKVMKYYDAHTLMPHWIYICMAGQHKFMVNTNLWRTIVSFQNNPHIFKLLVMFDMQHNFDPLPFFKGGVNFNYLAGGIWKIRQGWKYSVGAAFLKGGGGWHFLFNFFKVYHFYIYKLFYSAKLCYTLEEKLFFSTTKILWIKSF